MSAVAAAEHAEHPSFIPPEQFPADEYFGRATLGKVGMWIFLLSDALSFAGFLLAYGILRGESEVWWDKAKEPDFGITFTAILTFLLICSSVTMVLAYSAAVEGNRKKLVRYLLLTALGGALFLCGQAQEWFGVWHDKLGINFFGLWETGLYQRGLVFGHSHRATTFFIVTGFHGMHVFTGVTYLTVMAVRSAMGKYDRGNYNGIEVAGLFWHFVDLIWIIVFTLVYLIPV